MYVAANILITKNSVKSVARIQGNMEGNLRTRQTKPYFDNKFQGFAEREAIAIGVLYRRVCRAMKREWHCSYHVQ